MEYSGETTTEKRLAKCTPIEKNQKREEYLKKNDIDDKHIRSSERTLFF